MRRAKVQLFVALAFAAQLIGCFPEVDPNAAAVSGGGGMTNTTGGSNANGGDEQSDGGKTGGGDTACKASTGELLPQRSSILSNDVLPTERQIYVSDVFHEFEVQCKACHVDQAIGGFQVTKANYIGTMRNPKILERITSDDLTLAMPSPATLPYSQRPDGDPVRRLADLLQKWAAAGFPGDVFIEPLSTTGEKTPYALSTEAGTALTNIGTCVPGRDFAIGSDRDTMDQLDADFASRKAAPAGSTAKLQDKIGLPLELSDTDFTSFDSEVLARRGVVAFAPGYPLWSDDAGKLRYVRVPTGKSIVFDKKTQRFQIPDNTRFYKTFMKKVKDAQGNQRWRKLETRLIVARADVMATSDPAYVPQALFGTYEWDDAETHATLLIDSLRNGEPFSDNIVNFIEDEPREAEIRATMPNNLAYQLEYEGVLKHWAVPGSQRCIHCHEGSSNGNFILGFTPLQINRRPVGEGGVYEPSTPDELSQLQRLIDYGVITGIDSADDIVKLEESQGARKPRNDAELKAQAYLLGNCSHCHNPNGFPSVANAELGPLLDFYPSDIGGVFQFPLERYSPRITRGWNNGKIAYITPSLRDVVAPLSIGPLDLNYVPKYKEPDPSDFDPNAPPPSTVYFNAPWRSLIYRNVHTPFTYSDSLTLYPHMPFDTAGHDCRAAQWLGEWMTSIPSVRKHTNLVENFTRSSKLDSQLEGQDDDPQPYTEVSPDDARYDAALVAAKIRVDAFRKDARYALCPDNSDIFDPEVSAGRFPSPRDINDDGVPDHPNWVVTDLTGQPGLWEPRRTDWKDVLSKDPPTFPPITNDPNGLKLAAQKVLVEQLKSVHLSDVSDFTTKPFPMGLWQQKAGCKFEAIDKVSSSKFSGMARPSWFDEVVPAPSPDAPVFSVLPGQAIYDMICINCHGPNADSLGRQADTLQNLTGGAARVANFRFGLFNPGSFDTPYDKPDLGLQTNRTRVFGSVAGNGTSVDDWGGRYLAWMALGGTGIQIPSVILQQVARTDVLGLVRGRPLVDQGDVSANMLQVAQAACDSVLGFGLPFRLQDSRRVDRSLSSLIVKNGDAELWSQVCGLHNPQPLHRIYFTDTHPPLEKGKANVLAEFDPVVGCDASGQPSGCYPANAPIGDQFGRIVDGLHEGNSFPWCLSRSVPDVSVLEAFAAENAVDGKPLPICPLGIGVAEDLDAMVRWKNRGAINAGLAVDTFLDQFITGKVPHILYDQCEKLP